MADIDDTTADMPEAGPDASADTQPQVGILAQYTRDLSFENPNAPRAFQSTTPPQIEINVNVNAKRVGEEVFEVELRIEATARTDDMTAFVVELVYGGLF